jgi:hypothetical protein
VLEDVVIVGVTMALVEIVKRLALRVMAEDAVKQIVVPLAVLGIAAALNAANCYFFGDPTALRQAVAEGIKWGAVAAGVYGLGKAALGKS